VLPAACPRCNRPNSEWTVERPEARAGCPCGEVIAVTFDDEPKPTDRAPLSTTPKKPRGWVESARMDGWSATLTPSRRFAFALPFLLVPAFGYVALLGLVAHSVVLGAALVAALAWFLSWIIAYQIQRWSFAFEGGRFRVNARGTRHDLALDDIVGFVAHGQDKKADFRAARAFQLHVLRKNGEFTPIPLFVDDAAQAQFIADRANALLASGGREGNFGYRGEPLRVEAEEPHVRVAPAEEEPVSEDEARAERRQG
jgi:hypothetical protein